MRIIDGEGKDIPYYGFHYPINEHAKKLADPTYQVDPSFIFTYKAEEDMYIPIGYGMEHMNISEKMLEASQNPELLPELYPFEWFYDVTKAISKGKSVMVSTSYYGNLCQNILQYNFLLDFLLFVLCGFFYFSTFQRSFSMKQTLMMFMILL